MAREVLDPITPVFEDPQTFPLLDIRDGRLTGDDPFEPRMILFHRHFAHPIQRGGNPLASAMGRSRASAGQRKEKRGRHGLLRMRNVELNSFIPNSAFEAPPDTILRNRATSSHAF